MISGRFEITGYLGSGGLGKVFDAIDTELGGEVAVKVPELDTCPVGQRRSRLDHFVRECEFTEIFSSQNANTVPFVDDGISESEGWPFVYLVLEKMQGDSLEHKRKNSPAGRVALADFVQIAPPALEAAADLHDTGIVHRDIKPHNILIDSSGKGRLADFGIVRAQSFEPDILRAHQIEPSIFSDSLTDTQMYYGTEGYVAPEIIKEAGGYSAESDVYAAGKMIDVSLTGRSPRESSPISRHDKVRITKSDYDSVSSIVGELVMGCLESAPQDRPTMSEVVSRLQMAA